MKIEKINDNQIRCTLTRDDLNNRQLKLSELAYGTEKAKELFRPIYRVCKSTGQNGRILPNSILRPAIEAVTSIKLGPARLPLAPATEEEMAVTLGILKEIGKL